MELFSIQYNLDNPNMCGSKRMKMKRVPRDAIDKKEGTEWED